MFKKLIVLFSLVANTVLGTTFSNVQFETVSSNVNFISTRAITNQTAWIKSVLTNGAVGGSNVERLLVPAFEPNANVKLTNVNILAVFDNSAATNIYTVPYNQNYSTCFENEDVKHTTNFIMSTNARFGRFDISVAGTRVEEGNVMVINNRYYPIRKISNLGTNVDEVELMYRVYGEPTNTTQTVQAIYGLNFNSNNVSYGNFDGTNDLFRLVGSVASDSSTTMFPYFGNAGNFSYYNLTNEEFLVIRDARLWRLPSVQISLPQELSLVFKYANNAWKEWGSTAWRFTSVQAGQCLDTVNGRTYWSSFQQYVSGSIYKSTNYLDDRTVITMPFATTWWSRVTATLDDSVIYACSHSSWLGSTVGNGGYIYKSTNSGASWTALSNMGARYWSAIMCRDGTNIYAGTYGQGGSGTSASGGLFYSPDGGGTVITTSLKNATYGSGMAIGDIWLNAASNVVVNNSGSTSSTNNGIWISNFNGTNFTRWTINSFAVSHFIPHPMDTNTYYFNSWYTLPNSTTIGGMYIGKITNSSPSIVYITPRDETALKGVDYRSICFAPANRNIGYALFTRQADIPGQGVIVKTTDAGKSWTLTGTASNWWMSVATYDGQTVYAAQTYASTMEDPRIVYFSTNGGSTWTLIESSIGAWVKVIMPSSNKVYLTQKISNYNSDGNNSTFNSTIHEIDTTQNVLKIIGGRLSYYFDNSPNNYLRTTDGTNFYTMKTVDSSTTYSGGAYGSTALTSTNGGDYFQFIPFYNAYGAPSLGGTMQQNTGIGYAFYGISVSKDNSMAVAYCSAVGNVSDGGRIVTSTNFFKNLASSDVGISRVRGQVWISDNGDKLYSAIYNFTGESLRISTNRGSVWAVATTNIGNWTGVTSYDNGATALMCRPDSTMQLATNLLSRTNIGFTALSGTPSALWLNAIRSNLIYAFRGSQGVGYYTSTNGGTTWVTNNIQIQSINMYINWIDLDPTDATSNSYYITLHTAGSYAMPNIWKTTNNFTSIFPWNTNYVVQAIGSGGIASFDVAKTDPNKAFIAKLPVSSSANILMSTNGFQINDFYNSSWWTNNFTNTLIAAKYRAVFWLPELFYYNPLNRAAWTGLSTYDGNIIYAAVGVYGNTASNEYLYKIDLPNNVWRYLDNWRQRAWTDINTPDGKDIWATTRLEIHRNVTPPIPTNYYSIVTTCTAPTSTSWIKIQDTLATLNTYTDSFGEIYFTFSFDNNKSYVKWESANWRAVATNDSGWKYWNGSTYVSAYTNSATAAISDAMRYTTNQMTYTQTTGISPTNWISQLGFNTNITSNVYIGVTMRSQSNEVPNIQSLSFDYSAEGDNFRKKNAVTDGYKIEYEPTNGIYTIRRTGVTTDTYIYYIRK